MTGGVRDSGSNPKGFFLLLFFCGSTCPYLASIQSV